MIKTPRRIDIIKWLSEMMLEGHDEAAGGVLKHLRVLWARETLLEAVVEATYGLGLNHRTRRLIAALCALEDHDQENPR